MKPFYYGFTLRDEHDDGKGGGGGVDDNKDKGSKEGQPDDKGKSRYDDQEIESAVSLYRALQDPDLAEEIIGALAKKVNVKVDKSDTKKDIEKKIEGAVTRRFKAKLGKDYEKFSDMVGPLIDEAVQELLEERLGNERKQSQETSWEAAVNEFTETYTITKEVESIMKEMIEDSPPNLNRKNFNSQRYLARIYRAACEEAGVEASAKENRKSGRPTRRSSSDDGDMEIPDFVVKDAPKGGVSIDDAVDLAMKGIKLRYRS